MRRREAVIAIGAIAIADRARAETVRVGRWNAIPYGLDPAHPEPAELGRSRSGRSIARIPARAPQLAWERESVGDRERRGSRARPPIVAADGTIHVGTPHGIATFSLAGEERFLAQAGAVDASPAILPGGDLVSLARSGRVARISPAGAIVAQTELGVGLAAAPLVLDDGSIVIAGTDRTLRRIDGSLRERWSIVLEHAAAGAPSRDGDRIAVIAGHSLIDVELDGSIARSTAIGARGIGAAARAEDGTLWLTTSDGQLIAFDARRRERARLALGPSQLDDECPSIAPDFSVRVPARTALRAIGPGGDERWAATAGAAIDFPVRVDPDGAALVCDRTPRLIAFEPDGTERWRVPLSSPVTSAPVITAEGAIVCVGAQGRVIVLRAIG